MSRKVFACVLALVVGLLSFGAAAAQSSTPEPTPEGELALSDVIGNKAQYYGQQIIVEGTIEQLVNVDAFVVGDQAALNDHQLLVINDSGQPFDLGIKQDQKVRLIGTLYPSFNDGGWMELVGADSVNGPSPTEQANATAAATTTSGFVTPMTGALATAEMTPGVMVTPEMTMSAVSTEEAMVTPEAMSTVELTPNLTMTQQASAPVDLSQMFIPDALRDYTILVLNGLHITYLTS